MEFNTASPTIMHVDINSCFATVEQQANPRLRGKPVAVAAYAEDHGCILAASIEAKRMGIKTCMRVREARVLYPNLIVLPPDPDKYRYVNRALRTLLETYTPEVSVESIDEMVINLSHTPALRRASIESIAQEIKLRIRKEIGEWMSVSIGIAPNRYLAKVASDMQKPDGLVSITRENVVSMLSSLSLEDLCGIKLGNATRLRASGITTPLAMLAVSPKALQLAFRSIVGYHWWMRLHGYDLPAQAGDGSRYKAFGSEEGAQKSFGQSHAMGKPKAPNDPELWQVLAQLVAKMGRRLRQDGFVSYGVGVSLLYADRTQWGMQQKSSSALFADSDFYTHGRSILTLAPIRPVRILGISSYDLQSDAYTQQSFFGEEQKKRIITDAIDKVQDRFGDYVLTSGRMLSPHKTQQKQRGKVDRGEQKVLDRIAFGKIRQLTRPV